MNYIVLDLEWNQPATPEQKKHKPFTLTGEIIQIGAVRLDDNFRIQDNFKIDVRPKYYTKLQLHVRRIVGFSARRLSLGKSFTTAFERFITWCNRDYVFLTWGMNDIPILKDNIRLHNLDENSVPQSYNVQMVFRDQIDRSKTQHSLADALAHFDIEQTHKMHDALGDAYHTAQVCEKLDMAKGIADYSAITAPHDQDGRFLGDESSGYLYKEVHTVASKRAAMNDNRITTIHCPICERPMTYETWATQSIGRYLALASCTKHGEFIARLKFFKREPEKLRASKLIYEATEQLRALYYEKYEKCNGKTILYYQNRGKKRT